MVNIFCYYVIKKWLSNPGSKLVNLKPIGFSSLGQFSESR